MANEFIARNGLISQNNSTVTGSLIVTGGITGSLLGTASFATTASYALNAPSPKYELFSWRSIAGILTPARYSDFNPQNTNQNNIAQGYIEYLYVDILDYTNTTKHENLRFNTFTDLTDYITTLITSDYKVIFYSYRNDTSNLRISGTNNFIKGLKANDPHNKKHITSKRKIVADPTKPAFIALQTYLASQLISDITPSIPNFGTNYINQSQLNIIKEDYIGGDVNNTLRISPINKFKKRDFSRYYIGNWLSAVDSGGTKFSTSDSTKGKILGTILCTYDYNSIPKIYTSQFTTSYGYELLPKNRYAATGYGSYFHIYIIETADGGRVLAVEGMSIDMITLPPAYKKVTTGGDIIEPQVLIYRQGNTLRTEIPLKIQYAGVPQVSYRVPAKNTLRPSPYKVDAITLYTDGTCDVYPNALRPEIIKYNTSKLFHWKLNADYQKV